MHVALTKRFTSKYKIDKKTGCWDWVASRSKKGYGQFSASGKMRSPHRLSYECHVGPIPEGLQIDHLCRNKACCNPDHLEAVTGLENVRRALPYTKDGNWQSAKTHCPQGHEYTEENTYINEGLSTANRTCRKCRKLTMDEYEKKPARKAYRKAYAKEYYDKHKDPIDHSNAAKTHCKRGHPLSGENLYVAPGSSERHCRQCRKNARTFENQYNGDKTHCPLGHPLSGDNLYIIPSTGGRMCRQCKKKRAREAYEKKRLVKGLP